MHFIKGKIVEASDLIDEGNGVSEALQFHHSKLYWELLCVDQFRNESNSTWLRIFLH